MKSIIAVNLPAPTFKYSSRSVFSEKLILASGATRARFCNAPLPLEFEVALYYRLPQMSDDTDLCDPFDPFPEPVTIPITDVFDLHTIQPRDVKRVVEEYLKEAQAAGFRTVRIIHGKGVGVQREIVRTILGRTPFVLDWTDAPPEAGGLGATIVRLKLG